MQTNSSAQGWPATTKVIALIALSSLPLAFAARGEPGTVAKATGSITVDGETIQLEHVSVEHPNHGRWVNVLISSIALTPPCTPMDAMTIADHQPFAGVLLTIETETLELSPSLNGVFHPTIEAFVGYGAVRQGLALEASEPNRATGTLRDKITVNERLFVVDLELSIPLKVDNPPLTPRTVNGADSKPAKGFVKLVEAIIAGDLEAVMKSMTSEALAQAEAAELDADLLRDFADFMLPVTMTVTDTEIDGDSAVLTATGESPICLDTETSAGRIEMLREKGSWKVAKVSWNAG